MKRTRRPRRLTDRQLDRVACSCLLACAAADYAKKRARCLPRCGAAGCAWWSGLARLFLREYARGGVNLFEVDWE